MSNELKTVMYEIGLYVDFRSQHDWEHIERLVSVLITERDCYKAALEQVSDYLSRGSYAAAKVTAEAAFK